LKRNDRSKSGIRLKFKYFKNFKSHRNVAQFNSYLWLHFAQDDIHSFEAITYLRSRINKLLTPGDVIF